MKNYRLSAVLCLALCAFGPPQDEEIRSLIEALGGDEIAQRESAAQKLIEKGEPVRTFVTPLLQSPTPELRERARTILDRLDRRIHRDRLVASKAVPDRLLKQDPTLIDRILSTGQEDRDIALQDLTGFSMDEIRSNSPNRRWKRLYELTPREWEALSVEFRPEMEEFVRLVAARNKGWGSESDVECLRSPVFAEVLMATMKSKEPLERSFAAYTCGLLGFTQAEASLAALLKDAAPQPVQSAARAIGRMNLAALASNLVPLLTHEIPEVRHSAASALADLKFRDAKPVMLKCLREDPTLKLPIARYLGRVADETDLETLASLAADQDRRTEWLQADAARGLARIPGERSTNLLLEMLDTCSGWGLQEAARILVQRGTKGAFEKIAKACDRSEQANLWSAQLVYALRDLPAGDREGTLRRLLTHVKPMVRQSALDVVADLELHALAPDVAERLRANCDAYSAAALLALKWEDSVPLRALLEKLLGVPARLIARKIVRIEAAKGIGPLLEDPIAEIRIAAMEHLCRSGEAQGHARRITALMAAEEGEVRTMAIRSVGILNLRAAAPKLIELVERNEQPTDTLSAIETLSAWADPEALRVIDGLYRELPRDRSPLRRGAARAIAFLKSPDLLTKIERVSHINYMEEGPLLEALWTADPAERLRKSEAVRAQAETGRRGDWISAAAYVLIQGQGDAAKILRFLEDPSAGIRVGAVRAVRASEIRSAKDMLVKLLDDSDPEVVRHAVLTLLDFGFAVPRALAVAKDHLQIGSKGRWDEKNLFEVLNKLRNPRMWETLHKREIYLRFSGTLMSHELLAILEDDLGVKVRIKTCDTCHYGFSGEGFTSAAALLSDFVSGAIYENDAVVVRDRDGDEIRRIWIDWIDELLKRK